MKASIAAAETSGPVSPGKLVEAQRLLVDDSTTEGWNDLLSDDAYAIGTGATDVRAGRTAVTDLLTHEMPGGASLFASPRIRVEGAGAYIELDSARLRVTEVAGATDRGWKVQAVFLSVPISDADADRLAGAGNVPELADSVPGDNTRVVDRFAVDAAGTDALAAACASSTDLLVLGSAPDESWSDPRRAAEVVETWHMTFSVRGGIRTGTSKDGRLAWTATNLRSTTRRGTTQDYRAFFVYRIVDGKVQLALAHFSLPSLSAAQDKAEDVSASAGCDLSVNGSHLGDLDTAIVEENGVPASVSVSKGVLNKQLIYDLKYDKALLYGRPAIALGPYAVYNWRWFYLDDTRKVVGYANYVSNEPGQLRLIRDVIKGVGVTGWEVSRYNQKGQFHSSRHQCGAERR